MQQLECNQPIARKSHQCDLCLCTIDIYERYESSSYVDKDAGIYRFKCHLDCARIGARLMRHWQLDSYTAEDLDEWLFGGYFEGSFFDDDDLRVKERIDRRRQAQKQEQERVQVQVHASASDQAR